MSDPRPHDFIHGHEPGEQPDRMEVVEHNLQVAIGRIEFLADRLRHVEARLAAVERATPLRPPKKPPPRRA